ncbi:MAG: ATP-binding protein [Kineosporiaceae bacterium]|jgi:anti-sigma regulatory factor (Ser/Thr protein kinase)
MSPAEARSHSAAGHVLRLPHRAEAVAAARRRIRSALGEAGLSGPVLDDAEVVVSELLGNAVRHGHAIAGGVIVLGWQVLQSELQLRVTDGGGSGRAVEAREAPATAVCGRGLHIVERLSTSWGVTEHVGGLRTVWAMLPLESPPTLRLVR